MSLRRSKSPHLNNSIKSGEKEESFWDKFSTIGRKKGTKEGMNFLTYVICRCALIKSYQS